MLITLFVLEVTAHAFSEVYSSDEGPGVTVELWEDEGEERPSIGKRCS